MATARELGHDPEHLTARQALDVWIAASQVPFRVPRAADADGLFYGYGVSDADFRVELVRRLVGRDGEAHSHVRCELRVPVTPELAALGRYAEWCYEPPASPERLAWATELGRRPEWAELDRAARVEVAIVETDEETDVETDEV